MVDLGVFAPSVVWDRECREWVDVGLPMEVNAELDAFLADDLYVRVVQAPGVPHRV